MIHAEESKRRKQSRRSEWREITTNMMELKSRNLAA
jgi:hypothetical protein